MTKLYSNRSNARRAAATAGIADAEIYEKDGQFGFRQARRAGSLVTLATKIEDLGTVPADGANARAQEEANQTGETVYLRDPLTDKVLGSVKPKAAKAAKAAKPAKPAAKAAKAAPAKGRGDRAPSGMVAEIIKLATRKNGVTPTELNTLTEWKGAPWKWLMSNRKGTGYADRWGYTLEVLKGENGTAYKLTKNAA